jgi:myo-inositol 2-dehydrogenase/D-chiro-inositol 1-dehydrogenase
MPSAGRLKVAVVGLGRLGRRHAVNLARRVPRAELVAACSPAADERAYAKSELGVPHVFADYGALLAHPGLEAVFLVTPTTLHPRQILEGLHAGKHVFCEKPLSLDLAECRHVEAEARRHPHLKVMLGFVRRFDASYRAAHERIAAGAIGRPIIVRSHTLDKHDPSGFFVRFSGTSGGIFCDMSVHDIDAARWLLGDPEPRRVFSTGLIAMHDGLAAHDDVDNGMAICEFADGRIACFTASRTLAHGHEAMTEVTGTAGRLTIGGNPRLDRLDIADAHGVRNECTPTFYERFEDAFVRELNDFVDAVLDDRPPPLTLHDATEATRIGIAMRTSLLERRIVEL